MKLAALSSDRLTQRDESYIGDTSATVVAKRGEEILRLPVILGKRWSTEVRISPADAKMILLGMPAQRPLSKNNLKYFCDMIRSGRFKTTHQVIAFNRAGVLIDGQHRLTACVDVDMPIEVQASFNLEDDSFDSLDRGRPRSQADDLICGGIAEGRKNSQILAAAARQLFHYDAGRAPWSPYPKTSLAEIKDTLERHPHLDFAVAYAVKNERRGTGVPGSSMAAFYALFREVNPTKADDYLRQVVIGEGIYPGDPAYVMREYGRTARRVLKSHGHMACVIAFVRCWNALYEGRKISKTNTGFKDGTAAFPRVLGLKK